MAALRQWILGAPLLFAAGCGCNDQAFVPFNYTDLGHDYGKWLAMDVAPDGSPVIAYYDVFMGAVGFAIGRVQTDGSVQWKHEPIDGYPDSSGLDSGDVGQFCSMKVATDGTVWVAYYAKGALRVAHRVGGVWSAEVADGGSGLNPDIGQWTSVALDSHDAPAVAYFDAKKGVLMVAHRSGDAWTTEVAATGEPYDGVDAAGAAVHRDASVGMYANLVIQDDTEYITYYDAAQRDLNLLTGFSGAYAHTLVDHVDGGDVGEWPSLWTDGSSERIAYEDRGNGHLRYASREGSGGFTVATVDSGDFTGSDTKLFVRGDQPAIVYFDGRYNDEKMAVMNAQGTWDLTKLGGDDAAVGFFNEVIETRGHQYAGSYDYTNKTLFWKPLDPVTAE